MAKILNIDDYGAGYKQGREDGCLEGFIAGYEAAERDFEPRVAKLYAELQELTARITVLEKNI